MKDAVRRIARRSGLEISKASLESSADHRRRLVIEQEEINLVLDVGANAGQYGQALRDLGYTGRIVSIEPLGGPFGRLAERAASDPRWECIRSAVGAKRESVEMNVAADSVSSSLLNPASNGHEPIARMQTIANERVAVNRLDELVESTNGDRLLIKLDVQGFELEGLEGATGILDKARAIEVELSFGHVYENGAGALEVMDRLERDGFRCVSLSPVLTDPDTGFLLQADGLFLRSA